MLRSVTSLNALKRTVNGVSPRSISSIPYDPSLVIGSLVSAERLAKVEAIGAEQVKIDVAEDKLNNLSMAKAQLDNTVLQMTSMGVSPDEVIKKIDDMKPDLTAAAVDVANVKIGAYGAGGTLVKLQNDLNGMVDAQWESPLDYNKSIIKRMPLAADSIKLDAQYFSNDENKQDSKATVSKIQAYVSAATSFLGSSRSVHTSAAAGATVASQYERHQVAGTLVITATCTHNDAVLLAPLVLDVDKAIRVWNMIHRDDMIKPDDLSSLVKIAKEADTPDEKKLNILSGTTLGSSFIGMVHVLKESSTATSQSMSSATAKLQAQMKAGGWFAKMSGGFGVDKSFSSDVKRMLSMQNITSHVSMSVMGAIPSIRSNEVQLGVKQFKDFDPKSMMDKLAALHNTTNSDRDSMDAAATSARTGKEMAQLRASEIESQLSGLGEIDDGKNKMLDINTLMTGFEDYIQKAIDGHAGLPINYYVKPIPKSQLAWMWVSKYYPGYLNSQQDDGERTEDAAATS